MVASVTYILTLDHRAPNKGDSSDRGANGQERVFQDPTVLLAAQALAKRDPNAIIKIVAPDGFLADKSALPANAQLTVLQEKAGESRTAFYARYDATIAAFAMEARANGGKAVGIAPHYDALVHANEITAASVRTTPEWGGTHAIIHDSKATQGSKALSQRIVADAIDPAAKAGIAVAHDRGVATKNITKDNITLGVHAKDFDSQILVEIAAQDDAIGQMLQKKGVELTPAFTGVTLENKAGKGGAGFSAEVQAYGRWLSAGKPDLTLVKGADRPLLEKISKAIPLQEIPNAVAQHMQSTGFVDGLANALDSHATQDLGYAKATSNQKQSNTQKTPAVSTPPASAPTATPAADTSSSNTQASDNNPFSWIMKSFQSLISMIMPILAPIIAMITGGNNQSVAQNPETTSPQQPEPASPVVASNTLTPSPTPQRSTPSKEMTVAAR
jgi:hypothetical protein